MTESVIKQALKELPPGTPAAVKKFLADFYGNVPDDDLKMLEPVLMAHTALNHWDMSVKRKPGAPAVRICIIPGDAENPGLNRTVIDIVYDDMAFLVDSVAAEIGRHKRMIRLLLHPILQAKPGRNHRIASITAEGGEGSLPQSHMHIQLHGALAQAQMAEMEADLRHVLVNVGYATRDWMKIREKLRAAQSDVSTAPKSHGDGHLEEYAAFLDYLYRDNFTLLGYCEYSFSENKGKLKNRIVKGSSLGLLRDDTAPAFLGGEDGLPHDLQVIHRSMPPLVVAKVNRRSPVHRPVPMDAVAVKSYDKKGNVTGEHLFIGLFTSVTYSRSIQDIPLLRHKAETVLVRSGFRPGSHNFKALRHILEKYPRDELCQIDINDLEKTALSILRLQERQRIALYVRKDPFRRYVSCLVYIPRDRYSTFLRAKFQKILEEQLKGVCSDYQVNLDDSALARVIYIIDTDQKNSPHFDVHKIEALLQEAGRAWSDRLTGALLDAGTQEKDVPEIVHKYGDAFPAAYRDTYQPKQAVYDIAKTEEAVRNDRLSLELYRDKGCGPNNLRLKIYQKGTPVILSDILPVLENMGMQVLSELPFEVKPLGAAHSIWIHDFMMATTASFTPAQIESAKAKFEEALTRIWYGQMENDSLNHLVLGANMDWREIMVLRAYVRYLKQTRSPFSTPYVEKTLHRNSVIARSIVDLFLALFDPAGQKAAEKLAGKHRAAIEKALEKVTSLEEDRILRGVAALVNATLRTNFFQRDNEGKLKPYLAVKLDSKKVDDLPDPRPYREIWVYSTRVEGIHLRSDVIARGGIRWSDRFEDFRTEVLGLMKAQQVKNAIIVPMGAKGGFIVKKPPVVGGRSAYLQEGIECYKLFIRNLLELTDNRKGKAVIPPPNVVRRDMDDPYLVVAADKGTATFSDIANSLSIEFGFWLSDAFASGGSAGYDHKKIGITARGAWESVKRHFREMNHDTQEHPFDVTGVGDMAGDVYGNGMLQSDKMRVIGTFNHIHIFCDPDPDPAKTFRERKRLFEAVKGWEEYDTKLLSKGGRIYNRSEKSLKLTPEIMKRFEITKENVTPAELIQAMLRAPADLLFFGGIGTYLKASTESDANVGDKTNDALRINANEVRAKVIGEGANLAVTQAARIEYAKKGGRLNADFIDNSGGVNCSDVEVNIKILLNDVMSEPAHKLNILRRNELLVRMTDEVAQLVLRNNYQQVQGISLMEYRAADNLPMHARLIDDLEKDHGLSRRGAGLPDAEEIEARIKQGKGLTRPELAILQAHAKILYTREILGSDIPDMPEMEGRWLFDYFPVPLRMKFEKEIRRHRLRREIISTTLITSLVNRMGPVFIKSMADKTGASPAEVAKAFEVVREAFELDLLWAQIEALDNKVTAEIQMRAMRVITQMAERETLWFLTRLGRRLDISRDIKAFQQGIARLNDVLDDVVTDDRAATIRKRMDIALNEGLPPELARHIAIVAPLGAACDVTRISLEEKTDIKVIARIYFELGEYFHMHWLRQQARAMTARDRWTTEAVDGLIELYYAAQAGLTVRILRDMKKDLRNGKTPKGIVTRWVETHGHHAAQFAPFFSDIRREGKINMPILMLAESRLRQIHGG